MFKRKEALPPVVGDLCTVKKELLSKLVELDSYKQSSVSHFAKTYRNGRIESSMFNKVNNKRVLLQDCTLLYIDRKSIFKGLVRVVPVVVDGDGPTGSAIRRVMNSDKMDNCFLVSIKSLSLVSEAFFDTAVIEYSNYTKELVKEYLGRLALDTQKSVIANS